MLKFMTFLLVLVVHSYPTVEAQQNTDRAQQIAQKAGDSMLYTFQMMQKSDFVGQLREKIKQLKNQAAAVQPTPPPTPRKLNDDGTFSPEQLTQFIIPLMANAFSAGSAVVGGSM